MAAAPGAMGRILCLLFFDGLIVIASSLNRLNKWRSASLFSTTSQYGLISCSRSLASSIYRPHVVAAARLRLQMRSPQNLIKSDSRSLDSVCISNPEYPCAWATSNAGEAPVCLPEMPNREARLLVRCKALPQGLHPWSYYGRHLFWSRRHTG